MITIHKYSLNVADEQDVRMPMGAEILTVQLQYGEICLWAKVNPEMPMVPYHIKARGTGHDCRGVGHYIGTVQIAGGKLVIHYFVDIPVDQPHGFNQTIETAAQFTQ